MSLAQFKVNAAPIGLDSTFEVNGQELRARRAIISIDRNRVTTLTVELDGEGVVEGHGVVEVIAPDADPNATVAEWLANIDPQQLEVDAFAAAGSDAKLVAAVLDQLRRYVGQP